MRYRLPLAALTSPSKAPLNSASASPLCEQNSTNDKTAWLTSPLGGLSPKCKTCPIVRRQEPRKQLSLILGMAAPPPCAESPNLPHGKLENSVQGT